AIIFPCGRFTGTWTNHELFHAMQHHGVVIERIHETAGTAKAVKCYANFVETFFAERLAATSEAFKLIYKLLMNNLYGQLGMGGTITRSLTATPELLQQLKDGTRDAVLFGEALLTDVTIPLPDHVNYCHAAHVTAYGRTRLLDHLRAVGPANLVYCDTDSCFFFQDPAQPLPFATGRELGTMKLEGYGKRIDVLAPKTYRLVFPKKGPAGKKRWRWEAKAKGVLKKHARAFIEKGAVEYADPGGHQFL
ncbi:MAG: DNA polymerase, partial [Elusimicrobiota bacterium]